MTRNWIILFFLILHATRTYAATDRTLQKKCETILAESPPLKTPGYSIYITKDQEPLCNIQFGIANVRENIAVQEETIFRIGSITKTFTALAIMQLKEKGLISLEDPIHLYLPKLSTISTKDAPITIKDILTHRSGLIRDGYDLPTEVEIDDLVEWIAKQQLLFLPGDRYKYSNIGYALLGAVIQTIVKEPYENYIRSKILNPLGLKSTFFGSENTPKNIAMPYTWSGEEWQLANSPRLRAFSSSGEMYSNQIDLHRYANFMLGKLEPIEHILNLKNRKELLSVQANANLANAFTVGFAWHQRGFKKERIQAIMHTGAISGYLSSLYIDPKTGYIQTILVNNFHADEIDALEINLLKNLDGPILNQIIQDEAQREIEEQQSFGYKIVDYIRECETSDMNALFGANFLSEVSESDLRELFCSVRKEIFPLASLDFTSTLEFGAIRITIIGENDKGYHIDYWLSEMIPKKIRGIYFSYAQ